MRIIFEPGREWRFEALPPGTIALDGAVQGPRIDAASRRFSFDHHADCIRLITSATCQQVLDALALGLDPSEMDVLMNDLDGDTVLSAWLLEHHARWRDRRQLDTVRPLVWAVAAMDAHGPAYPAPSARLAATFHQNVIGPVRAVEGAWSAALLAGCLARLDEWYLAGLPDRCAPSAPPPELEVSVRGAFAVAIARTPSRRCGSSVAWLYDQGHNRLLLATSQDGGRVCYTLARRSDLVTRFPLDAFYDALNQAEASARGAALAPGQTWGGSSTVGGSPRDGSVLELHGVIATIERVLG